MKYNFLTVLITSGFYRVNSVLPAKVDDGEMREIGIKRPPAVVYYKPDEGKVFVIARAFVDEQEILKRIQDVEVGLWQPILLQF